MRVRHPARVREAHSKVVAALVAALEEALDRIASAEGQLDQEFGLSSDPPDLELVAFYDKANAVLALAKEGE